MPFGTSELLILLIVIIVLFGGSQIPKLARAVGGAQKEFKDAADEGKRSARRAPAALPAAQQREDVFAEAARHKPGTED